MTGVQSHDSPVGAALSDFVSDGGPERKHLPSKPTWMARRCWVGSAAVVWCSCVRKKLCSRGLALAVVTFFGAAALVSAFVCLPQLLSKRAGSALPVRHIAPLEFSDARAVQFAKLAGASYCSNKSIVEWDCGMKCDGIVVKGAQVCPGVATKSFVGIFEDRCLVSFMGTQAYLSFITDLKFFTHQTPWPGCTDCRVHSGFFYEFLTMKDCIVSALLAHGCKPADGLRMTGHSMGAALATIAMMSLRLSGWETIEAYTFGSPRTGDELFATNFQTNFGAASFRVTHRMDPIVHLPPIEYLFPDYRHVEPEYFYKGTRSDGFVRCDEDVNYSCSAFYNDIARDLLNIGDHLMYMDIIIGTPSCKEALAAAASNASLSLAEDASFPSYFPHAVDTSMLAIPGSEAVGDDVYTVGVV